jgi:hypothetical protein
MKWNWPTYDDSSRPTITSSSLIPIISTKDNNVAARLRHLSLIIPVFVGLGSQANSVGKDDPIQAEKGKEYHIARRQLISEGNIPLDQSHRSFRSCTGSEMICSMYHELSACAVDQPLCRFEWQSKGRRRFYIITSGTEEDPNNLIVLGMDYE